MRTFVCVFFASMLAAGLLGPSATGDEKLKPEDIVAKSLAAIGPADKRAEMKSCLMEGITRLRVITGTTGTMGGSAVLLSSGQKFRIAFPFATTNYWGEQFVFNGDKAEVGYVQAGKRSQLGVFINQSPEILREGLFGGVLTTAWPLLDIAGRQPKLSYDGLKKFNDRDLHRLSYRMKKGQGRVTINLFFEPDTFRHVGSSYVFIEAAPMGKTIEESSQQHETRNTLEEFFDDFRDAGGLMLPTQWRMRMTTSINPQSQVLEWEVRIARVTPNAPAEPKDLTIRPNNQ